MKTILSAALCWCFLVSLSFAQPRSDWPFCRVSWQDSSGRSFLGSGTQIDDNGRQCLVLTNFHVIDGARAGIQLSYLEGRRRTVGRVVYVDRRNDLAALVAPSAGARSMHLAPFTNPGQTFTYGGFGGDGRFRRVSGRVSSRAGLPAGAQYRTVRLTSRVRNGDSGGAVLDESQRMVGVLWGCSSDGTRATMGKPFYKFLVELKQYCENGSCYRPTSRLDRNIFYGSQGIDPLQVANNSPSGMPDFNFASMQDKGGSAPLFNPPAEPGPWTAREGSPDCKCGPDCPCGPTIPPVVDPPSTQPLPPDFGIPEQPGKSSAYAVPFEMTGTIKGVLLFPENPIQIPQPKEPSIRIDVNAPWKSIDGRPGMTRVSRTAAVEPQCASDRSDEYRRTLITLWWLNQVQQRQQQQAQQAEARAAEQRQQKLREWMWWQAMQQRREEQQRQAQQRPQVSPLAQMYLQEQLRQAWWRQNYPLTWWLFIR